MKFFSQSRVKLPPGGELSMSQQHALVFSQPETAFSQSENRDKLLRELLEAEQQHFVLDFSTAMSLLKVMLKQLPAANKHSSPLSEKLINQTINSLETIKMTLTLVSRNFVSPDEVSEFEHMYKVLLSSVFELFTYSSKSINTQVGFFIRSVLVTVTSRSIFWKSLGQICNHLLSICAHINAFLDGSNSNALSALPGTLSHLELSRMQAVEVSLTILQAFFRAILFSKDFQILCSQSKHATINQVSSDLWHYLKLVPFESDADPSCLNSHLLFSNICSISLKVDFCRELWVQLGLAWLFRVHKSISITSLSNDIIHTACSLGLDLIEFSSHHNITSIPHYVTPQFDLEVGNSSVESDMVKVFYIFTLVVNNASLPDKIKIIKTVSDFNSAFLRRRALEIAEVLEKQENYLSTSFSMTDLFKASFISTDIDTLSALKLFITDNFSSLSDSNKQWVIQRVGLSNCILQGHLNPKTLSCSQCNAGIVDWQSDRALSTDFTYIFSEILDNQVLHDSIPLRLECITSMKRVLISENLDFKINSCPIGTWLVECFKSSNRQLRLAAASIFPYSISSDRVGSIFNYLSSINLRHEQYLAETLTQTWGYLGKILDGDELNYVLLKLIDFLGSTHPLHSKFAFYQLWSIARHKNISCWDMMSSFWPTISYSVFRRYITHPQICSRFTELLQVTTSHLIQKTYRYSVPYLVDENFGDVLKAIGENANISVSQMLCDSLPKTVAVLLLNDSSEMHHKVMTLLSKADENFKRTQLAQIINSHRLAITFELLKMYKPDDSELSNKISQEFAFIGGLLYHNEIKQNSKKDPGEYLVDENILGLVIQFSEAVIEKKLSTPFSEKVFSLRGLSKLILCSGNSLSQSIPQIFAILQTAMETRKLHTHALKTWFDMIKKLQSSDLERVIDLTFSVIIQKWPIMYSSSKQQARSIFLFLLHERRNDMERLVKERGLPSLSSLLPDLQDVYDEIRDMRKAITSPLGQLKMLLTRSQDENVYVVRQTLEDICGFISREQETIRSILSNPATQHVISSLIRSLLNLPHKFQQINNDDISTLCAQCIGFLGSVESSKVDIHSYERPIIIINNFGDADETMKFVLHFIEKYLLKFFVSTTNPSRQAFLAYGIQEYLKFCDLTPASIKISPGEEYWKSFSLQSRLLLTPLMSSKYTISASSSSNASTKLTYPIFSPSISHFQWLQTFTLDMLSKAQGRNAETLFTLCRKIIKNQDLSLYYFIIPYVTMNVVCSDNKVEQENLLSEINTILSIDLIKFQNDSTELERVKKFFDVIFSMVDYFTQTLRKRQQALITSASAQERERVNKSANKTSPTDSDPFVRTISAFLKKIPATLMATRSFECKSYSRSLLYWEEYLRETIRKEDKSNEPQALESEKSYSTEDVYFKCMEIYAKIDDPDSLDGITTCFSSLPVLGKVFQYENTGNWDYALEWYEMLSKTSQWNIDLEYNMMKAIKNSGRYEDLLTRIDSYGNQNFDLPTNFLCLGIEAAWLTGDFDKLQLWVDRVPVTKSVSSIYEFNVGKALIALSESDYSMFHQHIKGAYKAIGSVLESSPATVVRESYESIIRLHGLADLESIGSLDRERFASIDEGAVTQKQLSKQLNERLEILGSNYDAKRYLLALRRAAMKASHLEYSKLEIELSWIATAKNSRKQHQYPLALRASIQSLPSDRFEAHIEYAKLLWAQEDHRAAIHALDSFVPNGLLKYLQSKAKQAVTPAGNSNLSATDEILGKATLLQTRWMEASGYANGLEIRERYDLISKVHSKWEKAHYYMAKYHQHVYESQLLLDPSTRTSESHFGDYVTIIVRSYIISLQFGFKYVYETLPKLITLWLEFSTKVDVVDLQSHEADQSKIVQKVIESRRSNLAAINRLLERYSVRVPSYLFYIALPQLFSRLLHHDSKVYHVIQMIIVHVTRTHPRQALWLLFAAVNSDRKERKERGDDLVKKLLSTPATLPSSQNFGLSQTFTPNSDAMTQTNIKSLVNSATKVTKELKNLSRAPVDKKQRRLRLSDLGFDSSCVPTGLVLPVAQCMCITFPSQSAAMKYHTAFPKNSMITIESLDNYCEAMLSLQRPKKIALIGSNGRRYRILCKDKDDVRKDARLNELTRSIDSLLKKDPMASKRKLGICTYWVTPLSEDGGLIEWVEGVKPLREILVENYRARGCNTNFSTIGQGLPPLEKYRAFIKYYRPVLKFWFIENFPEPSSWIDARTKYGRTLAVMSIIGFILGLGDRHGENILFDKTSGGIMHVDFDCLFDKARALGEPELVPFRLTHNMVDALGVSGYEGTFRKSCEITLQFLRNHQDMFLTNLETFHYDPISDWKKKKKFISKKIVKNGYKAANTSEEALTSIKNKLRGVLVEETTPLTVAGEVDTLIVQATDEKNLSGMYLGWMAFW